VFLIAHAVIIALAVLAIRRWKHEVDLWLWTASGAIAVLGGLRFFPHYYLQVLPPLCLLATGTLTSWKFALRRWVTAMLALVLVSTTIFYEAEAFAATDSRDARVAFDVATYFRRHTAYDDRVFVWGHAPEVYWASDRLPATRFPTTGFLTGASGGRPPDRVGMQYATSGAWDQFLDDLRRHPPSLVVDMSTADQRNARFYPPKRFPLFGKYLNSPQFHRVAVIDGATIYRRDGTRSQS